MPTTQKGKLGQHFLLFYFMFKCYVCVCYKIVIASDEQISDFWDRLENILRCFNSVLNSV